MALSSPINNAIQLETRTELDTGIANIHIEVLTPLTDTISVSYGSCDPLSPAETHHDIAKGVQALRSSRLVWVVPEGTPSHGCLTAWDSKTQVLVGKSRVLNLKPKRKRSFNPLLNRRDGNITTPIRMDNSSGIDSTGPWFDGVTYLKGRNVSQVDVEKAKSKSTYLLISFLVLLLITTVKGSGSLAVGWLA